MDHQRLERLHLAVHAFVNQLSELPASAASKPVMIVSIESFNKLLSIAKELLTEDSAFLPNELPTNAQGPCSTHVTYVDLRIAANQTFAVIQNRLPMGGVVIG